MKCVSAMLESYFIMQKSRATELRSPYMGEGEKVGLFSSAVSRSRVTPVDQLC
jgi:hypothetical protein